MTQLLYQKILGLVILLNLVLLDVLFVLIRRERGTVVRVRDYLKSVLVHFLS